MEGVILYHILKNNHVSEMNFETTSVFPNTKVLVYILRRYDVMMTSSYENIVPICVSRVLMSALH